MNTSPNQMTPEFVMACTGDSAQVEIHAFSELIEELEALDDQLANGGVSKTDYQALRSLKITQNKNIWGCFDFNATLV